MVKSVSKVASIKGLMTRLWPIILSKAGLTNSSKVTMVDTGLPGRQKIGVLPRRAKVVGRPGLMPTRWKRVSAPSSSSTVRTKSRSPVETPAEVIRASALSPSSIFSRVASRLSRAMPRMVGSAPISLRAVARAKVLLLMILSSPSGSPGSTNSSPVARTATLVGRKTETKIFP